MLVKSLFATWQTVRTIKWWRVERGCGGVREEKYWGRGWTGRGQEGHMPGKVEKWDKRRSGPLRPELLWRVFYVYIETYFLHLFKNLCIKEWPHGEAVCLCGGRGQY